MRRPHLLKLEIQPYELLLLLSTTHEIIVGERTLYPNKNKKEKQNRAAISSAPVSMNDNREELSFIDTGDPLVDGSTGGRCLLLAEVARLRPNLITARG